MDFQNSAWSNIQFFIPNSANLVQELGLYISYLVGNLVGTGTKYKALDAKKCLK